MLPCKAATDILAKLYPAGKKQSRFFHKKVLTKRPLTVKISIVVGLVAQLDRAFDYESKGRRFESCRGHHFEIDIARDCGVFLFFGFENNLRTKKEPATKTCSASRIIKH